MSIELTEQQQQTLAIEGEVPPRVIDPRNNAVFYLLAAKDYEAVRELLEEEQQQNAIRAVALRNAGGRMMGKPLFD